MTTFKVSLPEENQKDFNLDRNNPEEYLKQKDEIEKYLKNNCSKITENYKGVVLKVIPFERKKFPCWWCGYIASEDKSKLLEIAHNSYMYGGWSYVEDNMIGFDTAHYNDIVFPEGINKLDTIDNYKLENYTYKSGPWLLEQLKYCIDSLQQ